MKHEIDFLARAVVFFTNNPSGSAYSNGEVKPNCLIAVRWGIDNNHILVFRTSEYEEPRNWRQVFPHESDPKEGIVDRVARMKESIGQTETEERLKLAVEALKRVASGGIVHRVYNNTYSTKTSAAIARECLEKLGELIGVLK